MRLLTSILFLIVFNYSIAQDSTNAKWSIKNEILEVNRSMENEFNQGNYAKIGEFYADSAVMVGNKVEVKGKEYLIKYWGKFENLHDWKLENIEMTVLSSNLVLQRGYSNISYFNATELQTSRSIFSLIWIKTEGGWKILLDHFSPR